MDFKGLTDTARILYSPLPPCSDIRTGLTVLAASTYVIAKQLLATGRLDSFGLPMTALAMSSTLGVAAGAKTLYAVRKAQRIASEEQLPDMMSANGSVAPPAVPHNQAIGIKNLSAALGLAGSFGLLSNWVLSRQVPGQNAPDMNLLVPITFANSAAFKLLANSSSVPLAAVPYAKCIVLTGMLIGSATFQQIALKQRDDKALFALSSLLTVGLLPQTLHSIAELFRALNNLGTRSQNTA